MADLRHNPDLDEAFGEPTTTRPPLDQGQIDALTQALNDLKRTVETTQQQSGHGGGQAAQPWWFKYSQSKGMNAPSELPPWHYAWGIPGGVGMAGGVTAGMAGGGGPPRPPWWNKYAMGDEGAPEPDPEKHSFVRGHWRNKRVRAKRKRGADAFDKLFDPTAAPEATEYKSPAWKRRLKPDTWFTRFTRRAGARVGGRFGRKAGRATQQGLGAAAQSLMWGGSVQYAARRGIAAAAMAGGPMAAGLVLLGTAAHAAGQALNQMTREQIEYNRHLAQSSAQMAFVFAERDMQERMRERERGDRLSTSARVLVQSEQFRAESSKETETLWQKTKNYVGALWNVIQAIDTKISGIEGISHMVNTIMEMGSRDEERYFTMDEWARDTQRLDAEARKRKDPKWDPPKAN